MLLFNYSRCSQPISLSFIFGTQIKIKFNEIWEISVRYNYHFDASKLIHIRTEQSKFSEDLIALYDNNDCFKCAIHFFQFWLGSCLFLTVSTNKLINKKTVLTIVKHQSGSCVAVDGGIKSSQISSKRSSFAFQRWTKDLWVGNNVSS